MSAPAHALDGTGQVLAEAAERASEVLDRQDFRDRIGKLVRHSGGLLDPEVAALVVLDELDLAQAAEIVAPSYAKVLAPDELEPGLDGVIVEGRLLGMEPTRSFQRKDGSVGFVTGARIKGEEGVYKVTLWDDHIKDLVGVDPGTRVRMTGLYTKERKGEVEVHTGRDAALQVLDEDAEESGDEQTSQEQ